LFKMLKSRKGISPILATLLLIVIAVAAIIITYAWVITFTSTTTGQVTVLSVENIRFYDTNKTDIVIRNSGTSNAKIVTVYMGMSSTNLQNKTVSPALPQNLATDSSVTLTITHAGSWTVGTRYYFKVVTEAGQILPFNEKA